MSLEVAAASHVPTLSLRHARLLSELDHISGYIQTHPSFFNFGCLFIAQDRPTRPFDHLDLWAQTWLLILSLGAAAQSVATIASQAPT